MMPPMEECLILKNRVRELRTERNLRQSDLARQVGVTRQTILAIEKNRLNPSVRLSLKIAQVLGDRVDQVFYLEPATGISSVQAQCEATGSVV